ncbi:hypothetical protein QQ045_023198 [Rhodiola kirilowii]
MEKEINNGSSSRLPRTKQVQQFSLQSEPRIIRRVQVVYYLSRNGQLEHPHFMELFLPSPNQNLHLKDVLERLSAFRGRNMPSLYSWSCKRSYKHGYVWNDLADDDVIYPTQGAEYVLKGSELLQNCTEKLENLQLVKSKGSYFHSEQKQSRVLTLTGVTEPRAEAEQEKTEEEESSYSFSTNTPPSRCSVGISTDDIQHLISPPSLTSSSDKPIEPSRHSVLFQLIACGSSTIGFKNRFRQTPKLLTLNTDDSVAANICKQAAAVVNEDEAMIQCMSENPRFGGFQTDKEYFSGSIVDYVTAEERVAEESLGLKRSNSFNEERSRLEEEARKDDDEVKIERRPMVITRKCIPRRKKKTSGNHKC